MQTNPLEVLDRLESEMFSKGKYAWDSKNGTKARLLTAIGIMLKAGMEVKAIFQVILALETAFYVEHEKSVKNKTGLSVHEFMEQKLKNLGPLPNAETKVEPEICAGSTK
jgi:hypothetical protein